MNGYDLIIPVFKEKNIISLLDYLLLNTKNLNNIFICYDDESDITIEILNKSYHIKNHKIILTKNNFSGPCEAIKTGFKKVKSESIIVYPADDYSNGHLIEKMYELYQQGYDIVCPSRFIEGGEIKNCPLIKFLIVKIVSFILYYLSNIQIKDPTNGFRLFSKKIIDNNIIQSKKGFAYSLELLVKGRKKNLKVIEIPSTWIERNDRKSSFKVLKWSGEYLRWFFFAIFRLS